MSVDDITLRRMRESDLEGCLRLTQAVHWPHRLIDWQLHFKIGDGWVALNGDVIVGVTMWWKYDMRIATIGLVVVDGMLQGRGIGRRLMDVAMDSAGPCLQRLMATQAGMKLYEGCGFVAVGEIGQTQGEVTIETPVAAADDVAIRPASRDDLPVLVDLDAQAFGATRENLISAVLGDGNGVVAHRDGKPAGFALIRESGRGQTIGPVVATDEALAIALVSQLLAEASGFIRLDVDLTATQFMAWLETTGLKCIDTVIIMVKPHTPANAKPPYTYGLISQALG